MAQKLREFIERTYWKLKDNWWASVLLYVIPSLIIATISLLGEFIGLVDADGRLTIPGIVVTILALVFLLLYSVIKEYADYTFLQASKDGQKVLQRVLKGVNRTKEQKCSRFIAYIDQHQGQHPPNPFPYITQPERQISELLKELQKTFSQLFDIPENQLGLSFACRIDGGGEWLIPARINVGSVDHIRTIIANPNSTFQPIISDKTEIIFIPNKAKAVIAGIYSSGDRDYSHDHVGSIVCRAVDIEGSKKHIQGVLSISTYGKFLYEEGDRNTEKKIGQQILPPFITRLKLELALLYIKNQMYQEPNPP